MKPADYPLPWCAALDKPYWQINFDYIFMKPGWQKWQTGKPMSVIIPRIDEIIQLDRESGCAPVNQREHKEN